MEWMEEQHHQEMAARTAEALLARLNARPPIDPLVIANTERDILRTGGCDLGPRYDGKLEYVPSRGLFLLFYNTKYDAGLPEGEHHPRTRFSISHELGHFFIDHHHQSLRRGARPHRSLNEFRSARQIEREADAFAASLLMPTEFMLPLLNKSPLSMDRIDLLARHFGASTVSTAIRSVRLSDFPCAVAGIRNGAVSWMFLSDSLMEAGVYPQRGGLPLDASEAWSKMAAGMVERSGADSSVADWFATFDRDDLDELYVGAEFHPAPVTGTLVALLTLDEADLDQEEDDDISDDD